MVMDIAAAEKKTAASGLRRPQRATWELRARRHTNRAQPNSYSLRLATTF